MGGQKKTEGRFTTDRVDVIKELITGDGRSEEEGGEGKLV